MSEPDPVMTRSELEAELQLIELFPDLAHSRPLYQAARAQDLDLAFIQRETAMPPAWRTKRNLPLVVVVSDAVGTSAGPSTWRSVAELVTWAEIVILHRVGASTGHYAHARELAKTHLRTLLIEAPAGAFDDWLELVQRRAGLAVEVLK